MHSRYRELRRGMVRMLVSRILLITMMMVKVRVRHVSGMLDMLVRRRIEMRRTTDRRGAYRRTILGSVGWSRRVRMRVRMGEGSDWGRRGHALVCLRIVSRVDTGLRVDGMDVDGHLVIRRGL